jgi:hypothetical protein
MGPLIAAATQGTLNDWLDLGVAVVERGDRLGGTLGRYAINSDSLADSYLECLEAPTAPDEFRRLRRDPDTRELARYRGSFPPLHLVDRYLGRVGSALQDLLARRPASTVRLGTIAHSARLRDDGSVELGIFDPLGNCQILIGRSLVLALGGVQDWRTRPMLPGLCLADCRLSNVIPSDHLFSAPGLAEADETIASAGLRRIVVLGGSHSAYAAAWALARLPAARYLGPGRIVIVQRRPPRVFYADSTEAADDNYPVVPGDLCPRTKKVNRMGGLRGHGRAMWREIAQRPGTAPDQRVVTLPLPSLDPASLRALIEEAALIVPCFGYRSARLPIFDGSGRLLALNGDTVGKDCRLLQANGAPLANVFGIGLGSGFRPTATMGCEPNFDGQANSLWLYHNDIGALIHREIQLLLKETTAAIAA